MKSCPYLNLKNEAENMKLLLWMISQWTIGINWINLLIRHFRDNIFFSPYTYKNNLLVLQ